MNKFEAKSIAAENGWEKCLGYPYMKNKEYRKEVPTGELVVYLSIGYELSTDTPEDGATLELQHWKPSTAHPPVASRTAYITYASESTFLEWIKKTANELMELGLQKSEEGTLP